MKIRSIHTSAHETVHEAGAPVDPSTVVATCAVVVENPLAGRVEVIHPLCARDDPRRGLEIPVCRKRHPVVIERAGWRLRHR